MTTLAQLLTLQPEKLCSILSLPFTTVTQLGAEWFREHSSFPVVGLELYQSRLEEEVQVRTGSPSLYQMVGGLRGGLVYEVFRCSGSGKTELCLTAAAVCAEGGGRVTHVDTKGDFCAARFGDILVERGGDRLAMDRVRVARVATHKALLQAVTKEVEDMGDTKLFVYFCFKTLRKDKLRAGLQLCEHIITKAAPVSLQGCETDIRAGHLRGPELHSGRITLAKSQLVSISS